MSAAACAAPMQAPGMLAFAELAGQGQGPEEGRAVDKQLWLACAGSMCTVPPVGAAVYYFPQGHAEQASAAVDFSSAAVPPFVPCRVVAVRFMADPGTDEVFARMRLVPLRPSEPVEDVGEAAAEAMRGGEDESQAHNKPASFAKTLTQSDANNGGGFSVPRFCAETIFPELDYRAEPPVQHVHARDVHGADWKFRHIYRGTPRRHLLTTGWSHFVNQKKLLAGDSIVFLRGEDGQVHVGLRRAKRSGFSGAGNDSLSGWDPYSRGLVRGNGATTSSSSNGSGKVPAEDVVAAARLAAAGQPFEVVHYPRASSPEFCVRAAAVRAAMQVQWCPGMRFKMAFETEDSSRISWFMGTVAAVQPADPARWPQSPWRLLQVTWDEPELLQNVKRVCPWLVELVSSMPNLHLPPFSPPRKKPRIPPYTDAFPFVDAGRQLFDPAAAFSPHHPVPPLHHDQNHHHHHGFVPSFLPFPESSAAAGIQGARQAQFASSFSELHIGNLQQGLLLSGIRLPPTDHHAPRVPRISTDLTIGNPSPARQDAPSCSTSSGAKKPGDVKPQGIVLFGRTILTEEQIKGTNSSGSKTVSDAEKAPNTSEGSGSGVIQAGSPTKNNSSSSWKLQWSGDSGSQSSSEFGLEPGQCKVFVESDAVGRNLDLSALGSFEELYARMSDMFCIDDAELRGHVLYRTASGDVKHVGDEPFSAFVKSARRITILTDAGSDNLGGS